MNTLGELITTLQDLAEEHGEDAEVLIASLGYRSKMSYSIRDVVAVGTDSDDEAEGDEEDGGGDETTAVVYLVESESSEYLPGDARKAIEGY